ncbi:MAG TPA: DUF364 domain-containing protein [Anaerolineales bacterium]
MMMTILDDVLESIDGDASVRSILVGAHWTVVCSRYSGLASTVLSEKPHGHEVVREVGKLHMKGAREVAAFARSDNPLEASIGWATINSLLEVDTVSVVEVDAGELLIQHGAGKNVALVGHFPFIPQLRKTAKNLWVLEKHPVEGEYPAGAAPDLIPQADVVALTGSALINHTLDRLLSLCQPDALVMVLGPTTPLSTVLFDHGATLISGSRVVNEAAVLQTVGQGATFRQVAGIQKLTLSNPNLAGQK